jgi:hypothetical protein
MVIAWNILDHETTPGQRTLLDEIYHSNMTDARFRRRLDARFLALQENSNFRVLSIVPRRFQMLAELVELDQSAVPCNVMLDDFR